MTLRIAALLVASALPVPAEPMSVAQWGRAFAAPRLVGAGIEASGATLRYGQLSLTLSRGTLVPVLAAGRLVGVFFHGQGRFDLPAPAAPADAVFRTNVKRASSYSPNASGGIGDQIESALIMASSGLEGLAGERAWLTGSVPPGFEEWFARHLERLGNDRTPRWMDLMPRAFVEPPAEPLVMIEIAAARHDLAFRHDAMRDHVETLSVMNRRRSWIDVPQLKNRVWPTSCPRCRSAGPGSSRSPNGSCSVPSTSRWSTPTRCAPS
jgi:hypothetical protein